MPNWRRITFDHSHRRSASSSALVDPEDLRDLHPGEREAAAAQEELAGRAVQRDVPERHGREPAAAAQLAQGGVEGGAAQRLVGVVEGGEVELADGGHVRAGVTCRP
jgi:hypothetical protein